VKQETLRKQRDRLSGKYSPQWSEQEMNPQAFN